MNGTRLGLYQPALATVMDLTGGDQHQSSAGNVARRVAAAATVGICSASLGSPFYLVRVQLPPRRSITSGVTSGILTLFICVGAARACGCVRIR